MFIKTTWKGKMKFQGEDMENHTYIMDADKKYGGTGSGAKPKELVLMGLAGCTGMDVISILNKMKQKVDEFHIEINGKSSKGHPVVFNEITIIYIFKGKNLNKDKIAKAVALSQEKYCGVSAMLRKTASINYAIKIN